MVCGIYQLENTITSQVYIGRSVNVAKRIYTHFWKLRNRRHNNDHLQASFDKYGEASFIAHTLIICRIEDLPLYEKLAIKAFDAGNRDVGFNQMTVGENGHYVHTAEAKQKSTDSNLERWKDPEYRARMSVHYKRTAAKLWADPEFREIRSKAAT
jgi:group I intron endonuclease